MGMPGAVFQDKALVAIGAFDEIFVTHFQIDARMAQRGIAPLAAAVTGHARSGDFDGFGNIGGSRALGNLN